MHGWYYVVLVLSLYLWISAQCLEHDGSVMNPYQLVDHGRQINELGSRM